MGKLITFIIVIVLVVLGVFALKDDKAKKTMEYKEKAVALIGSIETGEQEPIGYINPEKYLQHNLMIEDGLEGFGKLLQQITQDTIQANVVRAFQDGDFVFLHTEYDLFGPQIGFDIFRFEDGLIVEHWDNVQTTVTETASGRSMIDGAVEVQDVDKTNANKELVKGLLEVVIIGGAFDKISDYISTEEYLQHNPLIGDGLDSLGKTFQAWAEAGTPTIITQNHKILGEGNFVLAVSEGTFMNKHVSFYDLFRIEDGKIVEHWDTIEEIPAEKDWKNSNGKFNF